eukprot:CAMPEP_0194521696 /NCGR_PEP_ID=MMETSP0253-20130528/56065_1 /TAXON_ID=2966 /ORGANISM="Noctiluca scintillans" /LENGTH=121 /DNA_ID=CAMNT_0039366075 /DNA_START=128 /DNA_END=495 /DNA_ORIENTATION=-
MASQRPAATDMPSSVAVSEDGKAADHGLVDPCQPPTDPNAETLCVAERFTWLTKNGAEVNFKPNGRRVITTVFSRPFGNSNVSNTSGVVFTVKSEFGVLGDPRGDAFVEPVELLGGQVLGV